MVKTVFPKLSGLGITEYRWPCCTGLYSLLLFGDHQQGAELCLKKSWIAISYHKSHKSGPTGCTSCTYHLPHLYDKQDCVHMINQEEIEDFDSVIGELPSDFTPEFLDFARIVIPNNELKTPKNPSEALNVY